MPMPRPSPMPGQMPMPGQLPMCGQMPMPGQSPMPGSHIPNYTHSAGNTPMPGIPPGYVPPYTTNSAYPGQTHNSPYLPVSNIY
jgi:hypothetical protein